MFPAIATTHGIRAGIGVLPGRLIFQPPPAVGVEVFEQPNFTGQSITLGIGHHPLQSAADLERAISSIKVPAGLVAILHDEADASGAYGRYVDLLEDHAELASLGFDNAAVYVDVFSATQTTTSVTVRDHRAIPPGTGAAVPDVQFVWARNAIVAGSFVAGHWERPRAGGPTPAGPAVVSPDPQPPNILHLAKLDGSPWENPAFDTTGADWSSAIVGGKTFDGTDAHPFEWVSILDPTVQQDDQVGATGTVLNPAPSGADLPVTHWFGNDWEFGLLPDPAFESLLAPSNRNPEGEYAPEFKAAHSLGLAVPAGIFPLEVDGENVPDAYRAEAGDRIAIYGRWIVDAGHDDFHSEIHPPLLMARARWLDDHDQKAEPSSSASTALQLWTRPYQVNQRFSSGGDHDVSLKQWAFDVLETTPGDADAYPQVFPKPFDGVHLVSLVLDPPPAPTARVAAGVRPHELRCSYQFVGNGSCGVEVRAAPNGGGVIVRLAFNSAAYPTDVPLPKRTMTTWNVKDLLAQAPGGVDLSWW